MATARRTRSDKKVGTIEKELGIQIYGANGRKIRKDKTLGEVRKQQGVSLTNDQKIAAKIEIKIPPKANLKRVNSVSKVVKKLNQK
ncbi:hypothetical protein J2I47_22945 [Fibrella sp. HMF5335]|uniref:Uncharacterized protein n=1 Tax=Fibrella rubiginis TaxID=2817060 RepID=A0A939GL43_9BACT|nr:hypothetical protein [Fibrella rubiginis]MBO0939425.1 hypothetical protein [Fibrella rubiginis]